MTTYRKIDEGAEKYKKDRTPRVSIIVPTYNQSHYLAACLDSIWFQNYPDLEIIVVNDGSTDSTKSVLVDYQYVVEKAQTSFASFYNEHTDIIERTQQPRYPTRGRQLRIIDHEMNKGLAAALNTGVAAVKGTYCTYVPSDDLLLPSMISEMVTELENGCDFVYSDMAIVNDAGRWVRHFPLPDYSFEACFGNWYLCGVAKLYRTDLHNQYGWYDEGLLAHDHELFQRFAEHGAKFRHIPRVLMYVRDHNKREVEIHSPSNWNRLLNESKMIVRKAREYIATSAEK